MQIADELLTDKELTNFLRERVPLFFNFDKAVSYTWNPLALADELRRWFKGEIRVHGQQWPKLES